MYTLTCCFNSNAIEWTSTSTIDCCYSNIVHSAGIQSRDSGLSAIINININKYIILSTGSCNYCVASYLSITVETGHLLPLDSDAVGCDCTSYD